MEPFVIKPRGIRIGDKTPRGYKRKLFEDAWARYLTPREDPSPPEQEHYDNHVRSMAYRTKPDFKSGRPRIDVPGLYRIGRWHFVA